MYMKVKILIILKFWWKNNPKNRFPNDEKHVTVTKHFFTWIYWNGCKFFFSKISVPLFDIGHFRCFVYMYRNKRKLLSIFNPYRNEMGLANGEQILEKWSHTMHVSSLAQGECKRKINKSFRTKFAYSGSKFGYIISMPYLPIFKHFNFSDFHFDTFKVFVQTTLKINKFDLFFKVAWT